MYILRYESKVIVWGLGSLEKNEKKEKKKMPTDIKIFIIVCVVIACVLVAAVVTLLIPKDIAKVKNNKVTQDEFKYYFYQNMQYLYAIGGSSMDQQTLIEYSKQMALSQAVQIEYLLQEAAKEGFKADENELNESWNAMESSINMGAEANNLSVGEFCEQSFGTSLKNLKSIHKDSFIAQKYREKKIGDIPVDESELTAFYEENKQQLDYSSVRHILVKCDRDAEEAVIQDKSKLAQEILDRVNNGEDFVALVEEFSEDTASVPTGGMYDVYAFSNFVPEFKEWALSHKVGETGIVQTDHGFHVMKVESIYDSLEAQRESIENAFKSNKFETAVGEALNTGEYAVEILDGYDEFEF
jgi:foldase protein PrsA